MSNRAFVPWIGWLALAGCAGGDSVFDACDDDADGFIEANCGGLDAGPTPDCAEGDASVFPGAPELCDGLDNDCDDAIDDEPDDGTLYFRDADGDGHGDVTDGLNACALPVGYAEIGDDCDDAVQAVSPSAEEVCNGVDDDCDVEIDESGERIVWFFDEDDDGYGLDGTEQLACASPGAGWVTQGGDCDDDDDDVFPGATETWYDGVDADCAEDDDYDADGDGSKAEAHGGNDCEDGLAAVHPGVSEVCNDHLDNDCDGGDGGCAYEGAVDLGVAADARIIDVAAGRSVGTGDVNGDGYDDVLVAGYAADAYLFSGPVQGNVSTTSATAHFGGAQNGLTTVASGGDVDGDGYDDILVGDPDGDAAYLFRGPAVGSFDVGSADLAVTSTSGIEVGGGLVLGDVVAAGHDDIAVGAPYVGAGEYNQVAVFAGNATGDRGMADGVCLMERVSIQEFGDELVIASVTGDAQSDLLIGAHSEGEVGRVYVVDGPIDGTTTIVGALELSGETKDDRFGEDLAGGCDLDGDGDEDDLVVAAPGFSSFDGSAFVMFGPFTTSRSVGSNDLRIRSTATDVSLGNGVACGDFDGDGVDDAFVSSMAMDTLNGTDSGAVWVFYGPLTAGLDTVAGANAVLMGEAGARVGEDLAVGDVNADGLDDLVIANQGAVRVVYGRGR